VVLHRPYRGFTQNTSYRGFTHDLDLWITLISYRGFTQTLSWFYTDSIVVSHRVGFFYTVIFNDYQRLTKIAFSKTLYLKHYIKH